MVVLDEVAAVGRLVNVKDVAAAKVDRGAFRLEVVELGPSSVGVGLGVTSRDLGQAEGAEGDGTRFVRFVPSRGRRERVTTRGRREAVVVVVVDVEERERSEVEGARVSSGVVSGLVSSLEEGRVREMRHAKTRTRE